MVFGLAVANPIGQSLASGALAVCEIIVPVASCMQVEEVAVKIIVHPLLQNSATPTRERFRELSGKMWAAGETSGVGRMPVAVEAMASPLGSPTRSPPPGEKEESKLESDCRKKRSVAPVSHRGGSRVRLLARFKLWAAG